MTILGGKGKKLGVFQSTTTRRGPYLLLEGKKWLGKGGG